MIPNLLSSLGQRKFLDFATPNWEYTPGGAGHFEDRFWPRHLAGQVITSAPVQGELPQLPKFMMGMDGSMLFGRDGKFNRTSAEDLLRAERNLTDIDKNFFSKYGKNSPGLMPIDINPRTELSVRPILNKITASPHPVSLAQALAAQPTSKIPAIHSQLAINTAKATTKGLGMMIPSAIIAHDYLEDKFPGIQDSTAFNALTTYGPETYLGSAALSNAYGARTLHRAQNLLPADMWGQKHLMRNHMVKNVGKIAAMYGVLALARKAFMSKPKQTERPSVEERTGEINKLSAIGPRTIQSFMDIAPTLMAALGLGYMMKRIGNHMGEKDLPPEPAGSSFVNMLRYSGSPVSFPARELAMGTMELNG